jgi:hypothetical protein
MHVNFKTPRRMQTILSWKGVLLGLGCAGALNGFAFGPLVSVPTALGNLPLCFQASPQTTPGSAQFLTRGANYQFLLSPTEVRIVLGKTGVKPVEVRMNFAGANSGAQMSGDDELPGKVNYFIGDNPAEWHTGMATFARVRVSRLYPGVNLVYYGDQRQLEYDFVIAPGIDPGVIKVRFNGVDKISIGDRGELLLAVAGGKILQPAPVIYQMVRGGHQAVEGGYRLLDAHTVAFTVGRYDHTLPLVIDPVLYFSTYFGGNASETAWSMALDTNGFIYVAGQTLSNQKSATNTTSFSTPGAFQTNFAGGTLTGDAFVAKFDNQGSNLIYLTYLGGSGEDLAANMAVDNAGDVFLTGSTSSPNFPTTNALYRTIGGTATTAGYLIDAFVTEIGPSGSNLVYSTYLGGNSMDGGTSLTIDSSNNVYVTGFTYSTNFPTTTNAIQKHLACVNSVYFNANAFVAEIGAFGTNLLYASYLGGTNFDAGEGIAIDSSNYVYVTGFTSSTNFPTTNAIQQQFISVITTTNAPPTNVVFVTNTFNGYLLNNGTNNQTTFFYDGFVAKFTPACTGVVYSTFLGGVNNDVPYHITVDALDNAYVTGWTVSTNFPNTVTNVAGLYNGLTNNIGFGVAPLITNAFLTQIMWNGTNAAIGWSTGFGGTNFGIDIGYGVTVDPSGNVFVVGASSTTNFPAVNTPGLFGTTNAGGSDAFVIAFNTNCSAILYSGYLGGSGNDYGYGIAVDSHTNVYLAGQTLSANFPTIAPIQPSLNGTSDAFLAKIGWVVLPPEITTQPSNQLVEASAIATNVVVVTGTPPLRFQWQVNGTNLTGTNIIGATNATMLISPAQTNNSGSYQCIITNYAGAVTSSVAILTVTPVPLITQQPTNLTVGVGQTASFNANGYAERPFALQWAKDGVNLTNGVTTNGSTISGATGVPLTISNVQTNDEGNYWIVITNNFGAVTSSVAVLTVVALPQIIVPPTNQTVGLGSTVTLPVTAVGAIPLSYQWQLGGTNLVNGGRIVGATNSTLTISNAQTGDDGGYSIIVTNAFGSVTSSPPAVLTVLVAPMFGGITAGTNGSFILSGAGGTNNGTYFVLTSTNLATPRGLWTPVATNQFNSLGQFVFTNFAPTDALQLFYILQSP